MKNPLRTDSAPDAGRAGVSVTRRALVPALGAGAAMVVPRHVLGGPGFKAPSERLNLAGIGVGGMGAVYLSNLKTENIISLCDVDHHYAARTFAEYPKALVYRDFRHMLEKEKDLDAVVIGTPDHTHAIIAATAMRMGKHVYCAKPLTRTIHEARMLAKLAAQTRLATQMSVQTCASEASCQTAEWVRSGAVGLVREVHVWSDRPIWPQGLARPSEKVAKPATLDWDLWLGPAPQRPYHPAYHPWVWRGWWDFGTGALGDMGCHTLHVIFRALELEHPIAVEASCPVIFRGYATLDAGGKRTRPRRENYAETAPACSMVSWTFPARGTLPPVRVTWYDGGLRPPRPLEIDSSFAMPRDGILFRGDKGVIFSKFTGGPQLWPASLRAGFSPPPATLPRSSGHYEEWVAACKGGPAPHCHFGFGSLLSETAILGNLAIRAGGYLEWDAAGARFPNRPEVDAWINEPARPGWAL